MRRSKTITRLSLVLLGLTVLTILPARTEKKKPGVDSMLHRMIKASEKAARDHGRPDAIPAAEIEFFKKTVVAGTRDGVPSVRVRMQVDPSTRQVIERMGIRTYGRTEGFATAVVPMARLAEIADLPGVLRMQAARVYRKEIEVSRPEVRSTHVQATYGSRGRGVIVGNIDTGVDWQNDDFRNPDGTTRIKFLWNQDDSCVGTPPPAPWDTGCLYTEAEINAALTGGPAITAPDADGHGTHTLGVSSGNGRSTGSGVPAGTYVGMAPEADIIVVKTFPEPGDGDCFSCFDLTGGLEFLDAMATDLGKPLVVNMSLGSQFGGHDGTDLDEMTIDALIGTGIPGRSVVKSAGNERGHAIHIGGFVAAGGTNTHNFVIPSYTPLLGSINDAIAWQLWYNNGDNLTVTIADPTTAPCGNTTLALAATTGQGLVGLNTTSGTMVIDDSNSPAPNGARFFDMEVDDQPPGSAPCRGTWQLRVRGNTITQGGRYDAWIWFSSFGAAGAEALWSAPEDARNISIPGTAFDVTTVGAYYSRVSWLSTDGSSYQFNFTPPAVLGALAAFSSGGPTRDGRIKPEIMAPGSAIASTLSVDAAPTVDPPLIVPDDHHWVLPGTSFSSPHVAGIYAQLLALNPNLDAIELRTLATGTARVDGNVPLPVPNNNWGYGKIDALAMADRAVQNIPDMVPSGPGGTFTWTGLPTATTYNVYRGDLSLVAPGYYGSCFGPPLPTPTFSDGTTPVEGGGFFYHVTGVWNGVEGSLGFTSDGTPRPNASPCP